MSLYILAASCVLLAGIARAPEAEIGRLQAILHYKVCGDPRHFVSVGAGGVLRGCVCPAGTEKSCQGLNCPRRSYGELRAS